MIPRKYEVFSTSTSAIIYLLFPLTFLSLSSFAQQNPKEEETEDLFSYLKSELKQQNDRITLLELQNRNQDGDIGFLKTDNLKIHNQIELIGEKLNGIGIPNSNTEPLRSIDVKADSDYVSINLKDHEKRAARLLPLSLLFNGKEEVIPTVPFNCSDLNQMGHTVNGIYMVKRSKMLNSGVNVVLCDFQPPGTNQKVTENRLGFVAVKSSNHLSGIYFYVQRGNGPTFRDGVIRFHKEQLNIGKAMNLSTGVFTAPKAGVYHFSFSIEKEGKSFLDALHIYLRVNGVRRGVAAVSPGPFSAPATMQSAFKLKKGDRVDLWKPIRGTLGQCSVIGEDDDDSTAEPPCHHFTGWLLEEDLN